MPHDLNGENLTVGTLVLVPCYVKAIHLTEHYCNVDLETMLGLPANYPRMEPARVMLNSKQVVTKPDGFRLLKPHFARAAPPDARSEET